ncbi:MAG: hypothetical protein ACUVT5_03420 [Candidatus Bathyarchaeales archaeon]
MKKIALIIFVLVGMLSLSTFTPLGRISSKAIVADKVSSAGIMAPPPLFPTNATFETKAEVVGNSSIVNVGGNAGVDYYAQSFKALSDYITNGGLSLRNYTGTTPDFRLLLCGSDASGLPNLYDVMAISPVIDGSILTSTARRFFLNLTSPVRVQQNRTYWLIIDGYYDHVSLGAGGSIERAGNPYLDGVFIWSSNNGTNWIPRTEYDLDFVVNFSNRPNKAEVLGTNIIVPIGGFSGSDYYAQSFKALDSYIVDAGVWIEANSGVTPNMRVQIWGNNATGGNHPNKNDVIASSRIISGNEINGTAGRYFVHPNVSIPVTVGETYWLVIDGYYDHTTNGTARSRYVSALNPYLDGNFVHSNDAGKTWFSWDTSDLNFIVMFSGSRSAIKLMKGSSIWEGIGGNGVNHYAGQSFKALNKYLLDIGVWLENTSLIAPTVRLLVCPPTAGNASQPDLLNYVARSIPITGQQISENPGIHYLRPTKPIEVVPGQTYFFIIDGYSLGNATAGNLLTRDHYRLNYDPQGAPYMDGVEVYSRNAGATWGIWSSYDLGLDAIFSDVPYEAQCGSTDKVFAFGWQAYTPYFAQSFVALNDYIYDAGIWLAPDTGTTPDFRLLLVGNNATDYDHPDMTNILASSMRIHGVVIAANPGRYYIKPSTPIRVERLQRYWIVIDGSYDKVTNGTGASRAVLYDAYPDGEFRWATHDLTEWHLSTGGQFDLHFDVIFTHVNQPPTQPDAMISPLKPFDSDDLTAWWPIPSADFEEEPVTYYVEWYKNSVPQPAWANNIVLPNSATSPTDDWMVKITPYDGHINGTSDTSMVHIQADILTIDHPITADSQTFHVFTKSNTTIIDFMFSYTTQGAPAFITFESTGPNGAKGFFNITIPKNLMYGSWAVVVNGVIVIPTITENSTHTFVYYTYSTSTVPVIIQATYAVPELTPTILILTTATITLAILIIKKKTTHKKT